MLAEFILQFNNFIAVAFDNLVAFEKAFAHIAIKLLHVIWFVFLSAYVVLKLSIFEVAAVLAIDAEARLLSC